MNVTLKQGGLYLCRAVYEACFAGAAAVILLREGEDFFILPVANPASGGYLLKWRNAAGDRLVHAPDFFRAHGIDDSAARVFPVSWYAEKSALQAPGAFDCKPGLHFE